MDIFDYVVDKSTDYGSSAPIRIGQPIQNLFDVAPSLQTNHKHIQQRQQQEETVAMAFYEVIEDKAGELHKKATLDDLVLLSENGILSLLGDPLFTSSSNALKAKSVKKLIRANEEVLGEANNGRCFDTPEGATSISVATSASLSKKKRKKVKKLKKLNTKNAKTVRKFITKYGHGAICDQLNKL